MKQKIILILTLVIFIFAGCNSDSGNETTVEIVNKFITLVREKNYEGAFELQKNDNWSDIENFKNSEEFANIDGVEILQVSAQDDKDGQAVVFAEITYQNTETGDETKKQFFYLKKFGGKWKIIKIGVANEDDIIYKEEENKETENNNNSKINWDGNYTYELDGGTNAGGTPIWATYELKINGTECSINADGYQLFCHIKCTGKIKGDSYEVYFKNYTEDSMCEYDEGQLLFTLKSENGQIITYDNKFLYEDKARELFIKEITKEQAVQDIRNKFKIVNDELKSYVKDVREIEVSEGGEAILYLKNNEEIRKIELVGLGSMGRTTNHYYFWDNAPFFVYTVEEYYDEPMSGNVVETVENRYYIYNNELIKWLDNNKKEVAITKFAKKEAELSGHITELIRLFF